MRRLALVLCLVPALALAQPVTDEPAAVDKPAAVELFEQGRVDLAAGNVDAACKKFELSLRKDPRAVGTLLNLALCNERQGKVASALTLFIEAFDRANEQSSVEQRTAAEEHIATLRPQVPFLVLSRTGTALPGEKLLIDDKVVALDEKEVAVDPGTHDVTLTAPGRLPFETQVSAKVSARVKLTLPELAIPKQGVVRESWRRSYGKFATITGGVLVLAAGGGLLYATRRYDAQFEDPDGAGPKLPHCGSGPKTEAGLETCDRTGKSKVDSARTIGTTSAVVGALGAATLVAGVYLWISAPGAVVVTPVAGPEGAGVSVSGRF
jgi:tetratricopeptide (TPR) repeat protein